MNKSFIIGRLTQDPTVTTFDSGNTCCRFSVAVNRPYSKNRDQTTDFINVVAWENLAQNCLKYIHKGSQVAVVGSIQTGGYEKNGIKYQTFEIRADSVEFLSTPQRSDDEPRAAKPTHTAGNPNLPVESSDVDDDMLF